MSAVAFADDATSRTTSALPQMQASKSAPAIILDQRAALAEAMQLACDAALAGDLDAVKGKLQAASSLEGYSVDAKGTRSRTPLYQSCLGRNPEVALWLLEQGAQDEVEGCGYVAICATGKGSEASTDSGERTAAIMRRFGFAGKKKKVKQKKQKKNTPPMEKQKKKGKKGKQHKQQQADGGKSPAEALERAVAATKAGDSGPLLAKGGGKHGELPIHHAARTGNAEALAALLAADCAKEQLLSGGKGGRLPAHYAVLSKDIPSLKAMIAAGGSEQLLQPDGAGLIPLQLAMSGSSTEVTMVLLGAGKEMAGAAAQCLAAGEGGALPLHHAATMGDEQLLSAMLGCGEAGQQSLSRDAEGRLPVHNVLRRASHAGGAARVPSITRCVASLVDAAGAEQLGVRDGSGLLALDYALDALAEAEANARAEVEEAEAGHSEYLSEAVEAHRVALSALEEAHAVALAGAQRQVADAFAQRDVAESKCSAAESKCSAAEAKTLAVEAAMELARTRHAEELAAQIAAVAKAQAAAKEAAVAATKALSTAASTRGMTLPNESVESLPMSPPRGPRSASSSWDGALELPAPPQLASAYEQAAHKYSYPAKQHLYMYPPQQQPGGWVYAAEREGEDVAALAGRVNSLAAELSTMLRTAG